MFDNDDDWLFLALLPDIRTEQEAKIFLFLLGLALMGLGIYYVFWA